MTEQAVLEALLSRLGYAGSDGAIVDADEVADWPPGVLQSLIDCDLLQRAPPALVIDCNGCEERCVMPVEITAPDAGRPARFRILCDRRDDMGPIAVDPARLDRWRLTGDALASAVVRWLGTRSPDGSSDRNGRWELGVVRADGRWRKVDLWIARVPRLTIEDQSIELRDLLHWESGRVAFASRRLARFVREVGGEKETSEARRARIAARKAELIAGGCKAFIKTIAAEEGITDTRVKEILKAKKPPAGSWDGLVAPSNPINSPGKKAKR